MTTPNDLASEISVRQKQHLRQQNVAHAQTARQIAMGLLALGMALSAILTFLLVLDGVLHHLHVWGR